MVESYRQFRTRNWYCRSYWQLPSTRRIIALLFIVALVTHLIYVASRACVSSWPERITIPAAGNSATGPYGETRNEAERSLVSAASETAEGNTGFSLSSYPFSSIKNVRRMSHGVRNGVELSALEAEYFPAGWHFDITGLDVLVFLHMQKTGGTTLGRALVKNLDIFNVDGQNTTQKPCACVKGLRRCRCNRPYTTSATVVPAPWLFSRYSTGWRCGLHADWTELTNCVDEFLDRTEKVHQKRRYFYITILRDPVQRYISEWLHNQRGATWRASRHWCGGREVGPKELPACIQSDTWSDNVTLEGFMSCRDNFADNRQTRMLADLALVGCYNSTYMPSHERDVVLLASAKANLRRMAFFALIERLDDAQVLFEHTFRNMRFRTPLFAAHVQQRSEHYQLTREQERKVRELNRLDLELYDYARGLFDRRLLAVTRGRGEVLDTDVTGSRITDSDAVLVVNSSISVADIQQPSLSRRFAAGISKTSAAYEDDVYNNVAADGTTR